MKDAITSKKCVYEMKMLAYHDVGTNGRIFRCLVCGERAKAPPLVKHQKGCLMKKVNNWYEEEYGT